MSLKWENYVWDEDHPATTEQVKEIESKLNITFPKDYVIFSIDHHGMSPESSVVPIGDGETILTTLLHFEVDSVEDENYTYSIYGTHNILKEYLNPLIVPFAIASGASNFCFDYRHSKDTPTIIFLDSDYGGDEGAIIPVANDFTEFLSMFKE